MRDIHTKPQPGRGYDPLRPASPENPVRVEISWAMGCRPKERAPIFGMSSDETFKQLHPIGYWFAVALGITALMLPAILYGTWLSRLSGTDGGWVLLGGVGGFIFGIGLFNFVAIILKQYLGHLVSILCFVRRHGADGSRRRNTALTPRSSFII